MTQTPPSVTPRALRGMFERAIAALGPFESQPHLAVAVSGGADSMALALLADGWARARGGRVHALTVDHGLRAESAAEAARVGSWLRVLGIEHRILPWTDVKPASALQARARAARYALLGAWCRSVGILHLLLAHQRQDQAETLFLRLASGSGPDGLAGMAAAVETPDVRVLRPLLDIPREDLRDYLRVLGQMWAEDPSNQDPRFARVRWRRLAPALETLGMTADTVATAARRFADVRVALETSAARLLARATRLDPAGFAVLSPAPFAEEPDEIAVRALARVLAVVGGRHYLPSLDKTADLYSAARSVRRRRSGIATLAGCALEHWNGTWLVRREARGLPAPEPMAVGRRSAWDGRFDVAIPVPTEDQEPFSLTLAPLGEKGWGDVVDHAPVLRGHPVPHAARLVLPAFHDDRGVVRVPHLGYARPGVSTVFPVWLMAATADFRPRRPLVGPGFFVAPVASAVDDAK